MFEKQRFAKRRLPSSLLAFLLVMLLLLLSGCDLGAATPTPTTPSVSPAPTGQADTGGPLPSDLEGVDPPTPVPSPIGLDEGARVGLYSQVISLLLVDESATEVFVSPYIGQGEQLDIPDENTPIPAGLLLALGAADVKRLYSALDFAEVVGVPEDGGLVKDMGVFLTLGPIVNDDKEKDVVRVRASIYRKLDSGGGQIFRFRRDATSPSGWKLLDATQEWLNTDQ